MKIDLCVGLGTKVRIPKVTDGPMLPYAAEAKAVTHYKNVENKFLYN